MDDTRVRQLRYRDRCKAAGLVQMATWVPVIRVRDVLELAEILREQSGALLPLDPAARALDQQLTLDLTIEEAFRDTLSQPCG